MPRLDQLVRAKFDLSWGKARSHIETGKVFVDGKAVTDPGAETRESAAIELKMNAPKKPRTESKFAPRVLHVDTQVIVVDKPSGLSTVPFEGEKLENLEEWVCEHLKQPRVVVVHRLDRETSGLVVFARNAEAGKKLAQQFRFHTVRRRYFALAHGRVKDGTIRSELVENRGDGIRGSGRGGKEAITHVRALAELEGMTLIECRLETGRTHQIRIHLSEAGHPLVGERLYVREFKDPRLEAPRLMLHAAELGFVHPTKDAPVLWRESPPADFQALLPSEVVGVIRNVINN